MKWLRFLFLFICTSSNIFAAAEITDDISDVAVNNDVPFSKLTLQESFSKLTLEEKQKAGWIQRERKTETETETQRSDEDVASATLKSTFIKKPPILEPNRKPHIALNCPENSGCTMFATILCFLMDVKVCRPDHNDYGYVPIWNVSLNETFVQKSVFTGFDSKTIPVYFRHSYRVLKNEYDSVDNEVGYFENTHGDATDLMGRDCVNQYELFPKSCGMFDDTDFVANELCTACGGGRWVKAKDGLLPGIHRHQFEAPYNYTHHIVLFKNPVQNLISLSRKWWCENQGGFRQKFNTAENVFRKVNSYSRWQDAVDGNRESEFSAIVFVEDIFEPKKLVALLDGLGLLQYVALDESDTTDDLLGLFTTRISQAVEGYMKANPRVVKSKKAYEKYLSGRLHPHLNRDMYTTGNYDGRRPQNFLYPNFCQALHQTWKLAPHLFAAYHPKWAQVYRSKATTAERELELGSTCDARTMAEGLHEEHKCMGGDKQDGSKPLKSRSRLTYYSKNITWVGCEGGCVCCY